MTNAELSHQYKRVDGATSDGRRPDRHFLVRVYFVYQTSVCARPLPDGGQCREVHSILAICLNALPESPTIMQCASENGLPYNVLTSMNITGSICVLVKMAPNMEGIVRCFLRPFHFAWGDAASTVFRCPPALP